MALKPGKLNELLVYLPKLLTYRRVKVLLQKVLGSLGCSCCFLNRLLALRKLKCPNHSIHF